MIEDLNKNFEFVMNSDSLNTPLIASESPIQSTCSPSFLEKSIINVPINETSDSSIDKSKNTLSRLILMAADECESKVAKSDIIQKALTIENDVTIKPGTRSYAGNCSPKSRYSAKSYFSIGSNLSFSRFSASNDPNVSAIEIINEV